MEMIKATGKEDKCLLQNGKMQSGKDGEGSTLHAVRSKDVAWKTWRREYLTCCKLQSCSLENMEKGVPYML